jgi:hypothetical protein
MCKHIIKAIHRIFSHLKHNFIKTQIIPILKLLARLWTWIMHKMSIKCTGLGERTSTKRSEGQHISTTLFSIFKIMGPPTIRVRTLSLVSHRHKTERWRQEQTSLVEVDNVQRKTTWWWILLRKQSKHLNVTLPSTPPHPSLTHAGFHTQGMD